MCQDKHKKIKRKLEHKNARSANIANLCNYGKTIVKDDHSSDSLGFTTEIKSKVDACYKWIHIRQMKAK